jgi:hypothetical protein
MISVFANKEDATGQYGIGHFFKKYGLVKGESELAVVYGEVPSEAKFRIKVHKNDMSNRMEGAIHYKGDVFPVFENATKLEANGEVLATFSNGLDEYPVIVKRKNEIEIGLDVFTETTKMLTGFLEPFWVEGTKFSEYLVKTPLVDVYEKMLMDCILLLSSENGIKFGQKDMWPDGKKFAVGLSHDVDLYKKTIQYFSHMWLDMTELDYAGAAREFRQIHIG